MRPDPYGLYYSTPGRPGGRFFTAWAATRKGRPTAIAAVPDRWTSAQLALEQQRLALTEQVRWHRLGVQQAAALYQSGYEAYLTQAQTAAYLEVFR